MSITLEQAKQALLNASVDLNLKGILLKVPPVPLGAMERFCNLLEKATELSAAASDESSVFNNLDFIRKLTPLIDELAIILAITLSEISDTSVEALVKLINHNNFFEVQLALMKASGLHPKDPINVDLEEKDSTEGKKLRKKNPIGNT